MRKFKVKTIHLPHEREGARIKVKTGLFFGLLVLWLSPVFGQDGASLRSKKISCRGDTLQLDSLSIDPESVKVYVKDSLVSAARFSVIPEKGMIVPKKKFKTDSLEVVYRVFPINFSKKYQRHSTDIIRPESDYFSNPYTYRPEKQRQESIFGSTRLNKTGSISRGIGFGNNQDLNVNSTLSLQLNGKITDDINVVASVTDDNIPIQPDGNTAQLQEFDQVFIRLFNEDSRLTAGDFIIQRPRGYFSTYFKRAQGASFETEKRIGTGDYKFFTQSSAAISRGKFARNIIQGSEGNQGPYRLRGNENEAFIVILAGTERVFIDGKEMQRGQENDYVIDYNTAEITFTANQLINKDKRIAVEFQYSDANFTRSLFQTSTGIENERFQFYVNFFSEQDAKNQPLQQELDDTDRQILSDAGDNLQNALAPGFDLADEYSNDRILYTLIDSLGYDSVFVRVTEPTTPLYNVNFSEVGAGNGDYVQDGFDATGRVFRWVAPDTLAGRVLRNGNFAPVRRLIAPKKNQLLMAGMKAKLSDRTSTQIEAGFSNTDQNTFSERDNRDNLSHGLMAQIEHRQPLSNKPGATELVGAVMVESRGDNFQPIEPYRSVEFRRNWNLNDSLEDNAQNIITGSFGIQKSEIYKIQYALERFDAGRDYRGMKNNLRADFDLDGLTAWFDGSVLNTEGVIRSRFTRHKSLIEKDLWITKIGFTDEREDNLRFNDGTDTLSASAYKFYDWQFYLTNVDSSKLGYKVFYRERTDYASEFDEYTESTHATHYGAELSVAGRPGNLLKATVSNRILEIVDPESTEQAPEQTLLMRLEHTGRFFKNVVTTNTFYEIGSGLERRQEFIYIQDPTGQGPYTWIDYNENGVKELNEFELARPEDGDRYIRVFTPTDTYEKAYSNQFSQSLNIQPAGLWMKESGIKKILARFSNQTAFRVQRKTRQEDEADRFNPFAAAIGEENLISQSSSIRNTFFFNRTSAKIGVDYTYSDQSGKNPLTSGFEERENRSHLVRGRYNFTSKYGVIIEHESGNRTSASDVIEGRDFSIDYFGLKPTFTYQPNTSFRANISGEYTEKVNEKKFGGESATLIDFGADLRLNKIEAGSYFMQINYITIDYSGQANNSLAYEMLEGLQNGKNVTWAAGIQRNLGKNLQLSLTYNGRKSEEAKAVHTGNVQVRAFF